ncbi:MAG: radical SAM family heme chaperone HemW [Candidatus Margulisiibacteriota bacterium]
MSAFGLYVHVPFCSHLCPYCAFYKTQWSADKETRYLQALATESAHYAAHFGKPAIRTVFLGGGTPSLLSLDALTQLFKTLRDAFNIPHGTEITLEMNPENVSKTNLAAYAALGITRISLGVQSFNTLELDALGRTHSPTALHEALHWLQTGPIPNFNVDLIFSTGVSTLSLLKKTLDTVLTIAPPHVSAYALSIEEGTPFHRKKVRPLPSHTELQHYDYIRKTLSKAGYTHYEVSAFAKPGFECQHNLIYWQLAPYIGLGPSAASYFDQFHFQNPTLDPYCQDPKPAFLKTPDAVWVSPQDHFYDFLIANLRRTQGIEIQDLIHRFGSRALPQKTVAKLQAEGLLYQSKTKLRATVKGLQLLDHVLGELLS